MGSVNRLIRRVPSRSDSKVLSASPGFYYRRRHLPVPGPPFRPSLCTTHLYKARQGDCGRAKEKRGKDFLLSGRLADPRPLGKIPPQTLEGHNRINNQFRPSHKLGEIKINSDSDPGFSWGVYRHPASGGSPPSPPGSENKGSCGTTPVQSTLDCQVLADFSGTLSKFSGYSSPLQTEDEATPATSPQVFLPTHGRNENLCPAISGDDKSHPMVAASLVSDLGEILQRPPSISGHPNRRFKPRLGRSHGLEEGVGRVEWSSTELSHKQVRNDGSTIGPQTLRVRVSGKVCHDKVGQSDSGCIPQQRGGNSVKNPLQTDVRDFDMVQQSQYHGEGIPHPGKGESHSRLFIEGTLSPLGMDAPHSCGPGDFQSIRQPTDRSVCLHTKQTDPYLLHQAQGPGSSGDGRFFDAMGQCFRLCFSSFRNHPQGASESRGGGSHHIASRPLVAPSTMVPDYNQPSVGQPSDSTDEEGHPEPTGDPTPLPRTQQADAYTVAYYRAAAIKAGLSERAANFSAECLRTSTRSTYDSRLGHYVRWCRQAKTDPGKASVGEIADFLISLYDKNLACNTIRGYRSAIAVLHEGFANGESVSSSTFLSRLMKSFFLSRPSRRLLAPAWSLPQVLISLSQPPFEPMHNASLRDLTIKTVFLLAAASGQRRSSIHALTTAPGHIRWEKNRVRLIPHGRFLAKNQRESSRPLEIVLPSISSFSSVREDRVWCPVRALKWYLGKTKQIRTSDQLFVSFIPPHRAVSADTISRWIVEAVKSAGDPVILHQTVRAHDTRGLAASWALFRGVPMEDIMKAAYWSNPNTFISCYLSDVLGDESSFARATLSGLHR